MDYDIISNLKRYESNVKIIMSHLIHNVIVACDVLILTDNIEVNYKEDILGVIVSEWLGMRFKVSEGD